MTDAQFFYWLQGFFELCGHTEPLNAVQADCIERHTKLVAASLAKGERLNERIQVVERMANMIRTEFSPALARVATTAIRTCVHEEFQHVIDPQAGGPEQQAKLDKIHGSLLPGERPVYRC